jgi:hypothetical protein
VVEGPDDLVGFIARIVSCHVHAWGNFCPWAEMVMDDLCTMHVVLDMRRSVLLAKGCKHDGENNEFSILALS